MAIPDYQSIMLPLLKFVSDGKEHTAKEAVTVLARQFDLSQDDLNELLPSGTQPTFHNRVGWAATYLKKAGLLESTKRSYFNITPRGKEVIAQNLPAINVRFLYQFPEFIEFQSKTKPESSNSVTSNISIQDSTATPEEILETAYQGIRQELVDELLLKIKSLSPAFFERLVVKLLVKMGYGGSVSEAGKALGKSGDGGIDGIIKEDIYTTVQNE